MNGIKAVFDIFQNSLDDLLNFLFGSLGDALHLTSDQIASLPDAIEPLLSVPVAGIFFSTALIAVLVWLFVYLLIP